VPEYQPIVDEVCKLVKEQADPARGQVPVDFCRAYLRRLPAALRLTPDQLAKQVESLFAFADERGHEPIAVRAFNPSQAEHGYEAPGTVVEVNVSDSPFLLDSVSNELIAHGLEVVNVLHPVVGADRDHQGRLVAMRHARDAANRESLQHYEVDRRLFEADLPSLENQVRRVLADVARAVRDFRPMRDRVGTMIQAVKAASAHYSYDEIAEAVAVLGWLWDLNFIFLGYREYEMIETPDGPAVAVVGGSGLGILSDEERSAYREPKLLSEMSPELADRFLSGDPVVISKTNSLSTVHRRTKMDYVGVRRLDHNGFSVGELRLVGLFTSKAYMEPASRIPLLRRKLAQIVGAEDLMEGSHDHKAVIQLFDSFPKHELFSAPTEALREEVMGLLALQERQQVRLFLRQDLLERKISLLVALPRDRFNASLRKRLQNLFMERFNGASVDYHLAMGESDPAQVHFTVWVQRGDIPEVPFDDLESEVVALTRTWQDHLEDLLRAQKGPARAADLVENWGGRFPEYYSSSTHLSVAAGDVANLDRLSDQQRFVVGLQNERGPGEKLTRVALYRLDGKLPLSDLVPTLEHLGLRVVEETATRLTGGDGNTFIHDFGVLTAEGQQLDLDADGERLAAALTAAWGGEAETDGLQRLIVLAGLDHNQVAILRAYRTYWRRVSPSFTVDYVNNILATFPKITRTLVLLFEARFDPQMSDVDPEPLRAELLSSLDEVPTLEADRILRGFMKLIEATVRTNVYRRRPWLSFKFQSGDVPEMPKPTPLTEIFVYGPDVEAIHLRGGMVARGGLRWSERQEDYRTEVLGLMKAQMTKNAVIVPTGAKGGFVPRHLPADSAGVRAAVRSAYVTFIRGLLDLTDNLVGGKIEPPENVRVHDGDDPYLVVAADKGTATFSDTANAVAAEYGFWLGDGFASGGSAGYDHKALGITARGAWESVKRHFIEMGTDPERDVMTVVGIGDMSGDVFGNGVLLSRSLKLLAAFDHRHIFIDPDPDPEASFSERRRLYDLPGSTWADYDVGLISPGGGVYSRTAKRIDLSEGARAALGITASRLTPNDLISAILSAPVDLFWNGGIGTFVKASTESHEDVADRTNDAVRVDGKSLRCRVVAEGGNLGFTQQGRIEYAAAGGRLNTDFIDNSGGVHCSDREVNLKILLGLAETDGLIDRAERDHLVASVSEHVVKAILYGNYLQAQILSQEERHCGRRIEAFAQLLDELESEGVLDRALEGLPSSEEMHERRRTGGRLTRPELAVLLAYSKRSLKDALVRSDLPDVPYLESELRAYFPEPIVRRFGHLLPHHPLRRELIANMVANDLVNSMGVTFVSRRAAQSGSDPAGVARAYRCARDVTGAVERWEAVERLSGRLDLSVLTELLEGVDWLVATTTRWFLARGAGPSLWEEIPRYRVGFKELAVAVPDIGPPQWQEEHEERVEALVGQGVPEDLARRHAYQGELVHGPDIIDVSVAIGKPELDVARVFFQIGQTAHLDRLDDLSSQVRAKSGWQRWALQSVSDDLLIVRRELAQAVLAGADGAAEAVAAFIERRQVELARFDKFMTSLEATAVDDLAQITVAIRQARTLLS